MSTAAAGLPLELVADDSVYDYEKAHLPDGAWPPTSWYAEWVSGQDVFDVAREECPIEMRWLVYQKPIWGGPTGRLVDVQVWIRAAVPEPCMARQTVWRVVLGPSPVDRENAEHDDH